MKKAMLDLLGSKKFLVLLASLLASLGAAVGLDLSPDLIAGAMSALVAVYLHAQGLADKGKEAVKAATAVSPVDPTR